MARAVGLYREHVRTVFGTELQHLRSDSDPSFAVSGHGDANTASALRNSLAASPPAGLLTFSPPYCQAMNPVENAVRHAYYLMNFFMAQAYLTMLAWSDMLLAAVAALNYLPRPQSRNELLRVKSPHEIATGVKPDLSTHIAAPGQLVVVHHAGAKASGCVPTAALCYYVKPSGAGSLVRDVRSWRCFVSYHVRPVRHEIDGIAAQAVAVSHVITSGNMRDGVGLLSASAAEVAASVRSLQAQRPLWGGAAGPIALLDPVTGLAVRLAYVRLDGTLVLDEEDADRVTGEPAAAAVPAIALGGVPEARALPAALVVPNGRLLDQLPGPNFVPPPPAATAPVSRRGAGSPPDRAPLGSWARGLPDDTPVGFVPNPKTGKSAARYSLYSAAANLGEYRRLNPAPQFVTADLVNDLARGLAQPIDGVGQSRRGLGGAGVGGVPGPRGGPRDCPRVRSTRGGQRPPRHVCRHRCRRRSASRSGASAGPVRRFPGRGRAVRGPRGRPALAPARRRRYRPAAAARGVPARGGGRLAQGLDLGEGDAPRPRVGHSRWVERKSLAGAQHGREREAGVDAVHAARLARRSSPIRPSRGDPAYSDPCLR